MSTTIINVPLSSIDRTTGKYLGISSYYDNLQSHPVSPERWNK